MTFTQILAVLRRRWSAFVVGLVVGLVAAAVTTAFLPPSYASTTSIYVRATDTGVGATSYTSNLLTQQLVKSYADLVTSQRVLNSVIQELGLDETADGLASHVDAQVQADSTILNVTVSDRSAAQAARLTQAVGQQLTATVTQIEQQGSYTVAFSTVDQPVVDDTPVSPRWPVSLAIGAVLGLLLGILLAAIWSATDRTVRSARALATAAGARALATVPRERRRRGEASPQPGSTDVYVEAVRRLRTTLLLADQGGACAVVTVAGPRAGTGTTTLVRALAASAAPSRRVLLVEGDLRRPSASVDLELASGAGLSDVLTGTGITESVVQPWRGIDVLTAGTAVEDSTAALSTPALQQLLESVRSSYDLILIDAPPLTPSLDGALFARLSDATVITGRAAVTTADEVAAVVETLHVQGARVLGTVLTFATGAAGGLDRFAPRDAADPVVATQPTAAGTAVLDPA